MTARTRRDTKNHKSGSQYSSVRSSGVRSSGRSSGPDAIAVIGMSCRVPGAHGVDDFWNLLSEGVDAVQDIPADRFDVDGLHNPTPGTPGAIISRRGGFLENIDQFDAGFFGISPREADSMDPQQRLLLECAWEALEDAGVPQRRGAGHNTGVFVGADSSNYWELQHRDNPDIYGVLGGGARSGLSGRLSFALDARGPSVTLDAACASSLVAVHMACQSLRAGESGMAIAAGVHMILAPWESIAFSAAGMLSEDGRCGFGDASANGFVRSEAVGVVVLKPLERALADGDPVRAVIRGSATSNDGVGSGLLMSPAVDGQIRMLSRAYADAGISPGDVDFVEAHGTGTQAGDPVELTALDQVLSQGRRKGSKAWVGSAKTNIGHAEAAAGVIGLIKAVLSMQHRTVPAVLHHHHPNPKIPWDDLALAVPRIGQPLDEDRQLIAGVSAFGVTGTNAHVVLTTPEPRPEPGVLLADEAVAEQGDAHVLVLSARSADALRDLVRFYLAYLGPGGPGREHALRDICYTAAQRRTHHEYRLAVVGDGHDTIADALRSSLHNGPEVRAAVRPGIAFVFPGQGSQWSGMGRELLEVSPAFRAAIHRCDDAIRAEAGWSLLEKLADPDTVWEGIDLVQPALWAMEVALAETWKAWGVEPSTVIGHSMGEAAAACVAGALSLEDGAAVICRRSRLMKRVAGNGAMAVVELDAGRAAALAAETHGVSVAAFNSPGSTVLAGNAAELDSIRERLEAQEIFCRLVHVDVASHSAQVDPLLDDLKAELAPLAPRTVTTALHSTVLDERVDGRELDASYWVRNLREPVRFVQAVEAVRATTATAFVEISPHPVLGHSVQETVRDSTSSAHTSLRRKQPEREAMLTTWARLYELGAAVDPSGLYPGGRYVALPQYPWQRERYWIAGETAAPSPSATILELDPSAERYLVEHRIRGVAVVPGTALIDAVRTAWARQYGTGPVLLEDVFFSEGLTVQESLPVRLRITLAPDAAGEARSARFAVASQPLTGTPEGHWTTHCTGRVREAGAAAPAGEGLDAVRRRCVTEWEPAGFYRAAAGAGADWGPANQAVRTLWTGTGEALALVRLPDGLPLGRDAVHPALLEAAAQPLLAVLEATAPFVATSIDQVHLVRDAAEVWSHARIRAADPDGTVVADVVLLDEGHHVVARMEGLRLLLLGTPAGPAVPKDDAAPSYRSTPARPGAAGAPHHITEPEGVPIVEITGEIHIRDAQQRLVVELSGSLRVGTPAAQPGPGAPAATMGVTQQPAAPAGGQAPALTAAPPAETDALTRIAPPVRTTPFAAPTAPEAAPSLNGSGGTRQAVQTRPAAAPAPAAGTAEEPTTAPGEQILAEVSRVLRLPVSRLETSRSLTDQGLDSLMALELKNRLQQASGGSVTVRQILDAESVDALVRDLTAEGKTQP